ncbi:MAG: Hint domain-containing protein [Eubacterium sp.]|nr:Hint domain-containing protein [Eubacterium sp.]
MENTQAQALDNLFSGIEDFQKEFPAIYKDIGQREAGQKEVKEGVTFRSSTVNTGNDAGWQDFEKIHMVYHPKEKKLRIKGRIHRTVQASYAMAELSVRNQCREIYRRRYTVTGSNFLTIDEELTVEPDHLDGIYAEMRYVFQTSPQSPKIPYGKMETRCEEVGIDIVGEGKILHPVSRHGRDKIDIVYGRTDKKNTADYYYDGSYTLTSGDGRFYILLPAAVQFQLDTGFALSDHPDVSGEIYVFSNNHGVSHFDNWTKVQMIPASRWNNVDRVYPEIDERFPSGYLFVLPQEWKVPIAKKGISSDDDFYLSLDIRFTCRDGKRYSLEMDSRLNPRPYSRGAEIEIPCFHILWGCIEKNAQIEVQGKGRIPVAEVQVGEKVLAKDHAYEMVCDILTGDEEILKYVKVNGQELMVTMDHPVMTKAGWMPARELREGDPILCEDGNFYPIQEIYDEPYYDKVYSLNLEHGEGFFANQIYVGDFKMQNSFQKEEIEIPKEILDELKKFENLA